jgi:hypothetical protein
MNKPPRTIVKAQPRQMKLVTVPDHFRAMSFEQLVDASIQSGEAGRELAYRLAARVNRATCTPCERTRAAAELRVWLSKREVTP